MKKLSLVLCVVLAFTLLAGCGGSASGGLSSSSTPPSSSSSSGSSSSSSSSGESGSSSPSDYGSPNDYAEVIRNARPAELNESGMYDVVAGPEDAHYDMVFYEGSVFDDSIYERYGMSITSVIVLAYGVAIILPKEGQEQAVLDQVYDFVEQQKKAQENYLPLQYEIASNAIVKTARTGEVLLAMCEDAEDVMAKMEAGLAA